MKDPFAGQFAGPFVGHPLLFLEYDRFATSLLSDGWFDVRKWPINSCGG